MKVGELGMRHHGSAPRGWRKTVDVRVCRGGGGLPSAPLASLDRCRCMHSGKIYRYGPVNPNGKPCELPTQIPCHVVVNWWATAILDDWRGSR